MKKHYYIFACSFFFALGANMLDQLLDDIEVDIGLEEGDTDFPQGLLHVFLGDGALTAKILEGALQFFGEIFKHGDTLSLSASGVGTPPQRRDTGLATPAFGAARYDGSMQRLHSKRDDEKRSNPIHIGVTGTPAPTRFHPFENTRSVRSDKEIASADHDGEGAKFPAHSDE